MHGCRRGLGLRHHRHLHSHRHGLIGHHRPAADAYRFLAFFDFDFGDARFLKQFDEFFDLSDIQPSPLRPAAGQALSLIDEIAGRSWPRQVVVGGAQGEFVALDAQPGNHADRNV